MSITVRPWGCYCSPDSDLLSSRFEESRCEYCVPASDLLISERRATEDRTAYTASGSEGSFRKRSITTELACDCRDDVLEVLQRVASVMYGVTVTDLVEPGRAGRSVPVAFVAD